MAYVITQLCLGEQYAHCIDVCPVNCIYPGKYKQQPFMVIDPDICISCDACLSVCPVGAIVNSETLHPKDAKLNKTLSKTFRHNPSVTPRPDNDPPRINGMS